MEAYNFKFIGPPEEETSDGLSMTGDHWRRSLLTAPAQILAFLGMVRVATLGQLARFYARDWQTVSKSDEHLVLRLMERGDFVAQLTITPWTRAEKGKHLTADEFRQAMSQTPGWEAGAKPAIGS